MNNQERRCTAAHALKFLPRAHANTGDELPMKVCAVTVHACMSLTVCTSWEGDCTDNTECKGQEVLLITNILKYSFKADQFFLEVFTAHTL